jgi:anthranilate synthase component II
MILVIDNYDSFTYNLVHIVAGSTTDLVVRRNDKVTLSDVADMDPDGILLSPGPGRPADAGIITDLIRRLEGRIPVLGICLGHQAIGEVYGGTVTYAPELMHGKTSLISHCGNGIFAGIPQKFEATRYHSLVVSPDHIPDSLEVTASSEDGVIMGLRHRTHPVEGIQFHPESLLTVEGPAIIENWLSPLT